MESSRSVHPNGSGVTHAWVEVSDVRLHYVRAGTNADAPLVLLHGFPQSWLMWRHVLPALAARHLVIAPDLRGYGASGKPGGAARYDKGTMAADVAALIRHLGLRRPVLIGHDRGARVARRYALDYPDDLAGVALLDILPAEYVYDRLSAAEIARSYWHWVFHIVPDLPERLIAGNEEAYLAALFGRAPGVIERLRADGAWDVYSQAFRSEGALAAMLRDYRATYADDVPRYRAERAAGVKVRVPVFLLWGERGNLAGRPVVDIWREVAQSVTGRALRDCGHYVAEEQPEAVATELLRFAAACYAAAPDEKSARQAPESSEE